MVSKAPGNPYSISTGNSDVDAVFHFFDNLDYAGHASGFTPANPVYRSQLSTIDGLIGIVLTAIRNRPTFAVEDWQIVVTSDHGGRGTGHGIAAADNDTIPFLVSSRSVGQGWLSGTPSVVDVPPTVLAYFNVPFPAHVDGVARAFDLVDISAGDRVFLAGSHSRTGNGMMSVGHNGILYKLAQNVQPVGNIDSALPWNIGRDGAGASTASLNATIDELSFWRRELRDDEVRTLWAMGAGPPSSPLVAYSDEFVGLEDTALEVAAPGLLVNDVLPAVTLFSENFDGLPLGPTVEDVPGDGTDFTHAPPTGWTVDRLGVPGWGTANDGMQEWAGWSFADKDYWITASGNQNRSDFARGSGTIAVADRTNGMTPRARPEHITRCSRPRRSALRAFGPTP